METDIQELYKLRYHFVEVRTRIKKKDDYATSFCKPSSDLGKTNRRKVEPLSYTGYLKTVDPISKSAILCDIDDSGVINNILILGHVITSISGFAKDQVIPPHEIEKLIETDFKRKLCNNTCFKVKEPFKQVTNEEIAIRKNEILEWLRSNRIPASINHQSGEICIEDTVRVKPPYERESDYICPTKLILKRVKKIIEDRPNSTLIINQDDQNFKT